MIISKKALIRSSKIILILLSFLFVFYIIFNLPNTNATTMKATNTTSLSYVATMTPQSHFITISNFSNITNASILVDFSSFTAGALRLIINDNNLDELTAGTQFNVYNIQSYLKQGINNITYSPTEVTTATLIASNITYEFSSIIFVNPTPNNSSSQFARSIPVNFSTNESTHSYAFLNYDDTLLNWWRFEGNSTLHKNEVLTALNLTCSVCPILNSTGVFNQSVTFNGTPSNFNLNISSPAFNMNMSGKNMTISFWINRVLNGVYNRVIESSENAGANGGFFVQIDNANKIQFYTSDGIAGGTTSTLSTGTISQGSWYHVALTLDGTNGSIYINGTLDSSATKEAMNGSPFQVQVGGSQANNYMNGSLDEILVFRRALDSSEIKMLFNASANKFYRNFTNVSVGNHTIKAFLVNSTGFKSETEQRTIQILPSNLTFTGVPGHRQIAYGSGFNAQFNATDTFVFVNLTLPVADRWQKKAFYNAWRDQHGQETIGDMDYLAQGEDPENLLPHTNEFYAYNWTSNEFTNLTGSGFPLPDFVWAMQSVCFKKLDETSIILHGGRGRYNASFSITETNRTYLINVSSRTITQLKNSTYAREDMSCTIHDGIMEVMGGGNGPSGVTDMYQVERYNYTSNTWQNRTNLTYSQFRVKGDGGAVSGSGRRCYFGGAGNITSVPAYPHLPYPVYNVICYNETTNVYDEIVNLSMQISYREAEMIDDIGIVGVGAGNHLNNNTRYMQIVNITAKTTYVSPMQSPFLGTAGSGLSKRNGTIGLWGGTNHLGTHNQNYWTYNYNVKDLFMINSSGYLQNASANLPIGYYGLRIQVNNSDGVTKFVNWSINVTDNVAPINLSHSASDTSITSRWFDDTDTDSVKININGVNYTTNRSNDEYSYDVASFAVGNYSYYWVSNDTLGNQRVTSTSNFSIAASPIPPSSAGPGGLAILSNASGNYTIIAGNILTGDSSIVDKISNKAKKFFNWDNIKYNLDNYIGFIFLGILILVIVIIGLRGSTPSTKN